MFEVGQKVLCIAVTPMDEYDEPLFMDRLAVGSVYTIRQAFGYFYVPSLGANIDGSIVRLNEIVLPKDETTGFEWSYDARCFRPIDDPSIEIFRQMVKELEDV